MSGTRGRQSGAMDTTRELVAALDGLTAEAENAIANAGSQAELEALRVRFLGRKEGQLTTVMRRLGTLSPEARPAVGEAANRAKARVSELLEAKAASLDAGERAAATADLTLPGRLPWRGGRHPVPGTSPRSTRSPARGRW